MSGLKEGAFFGKYRIIRQIGRGGMGVVYLAEDTLLGRDVALKLLDRVFAADEDFDFRFRQEARTIAGIDHPNIVRIHAFEQIEERWFIDMPYLRGGALAGGEQDGSITLHQTLHYMLGILDALGCCHDAGIIHRDVKPTNILIKSPERALLSDFGLSKLLARYHEESISSISSSGFFMGTPRYAPPESWDGCDPTPAWDVYSAGMILFEAASSRTAYDAATPLALVKQMADRPIPPLSEVAPHVSPELSAVVAAMLDCNPEARPKDGRAALELMAQVPELRENLDASTQMRVAIPRPIRVHAKPSLFARAVTRRRLWLGGMAVLLSMVVLFALHPLRNLTRTSHGERPLSAGIPKEDSDGHERALWSFDIVDSSTREIWRNQGSAHRGTDAGDWPILIFGRSYLWFLRASAEGEDLVVLEGYWAEYGDESARVFRHGTVKGSGQWLTAGQVMTVSLEFTCAQDASTNTRALVWRSAERPESEDAFVRKFEEAPTLQTLLYNELVPRHQAWVEDVERIFLGAVTPVLKVREVDFGPTGIQLDGKLDEGPWRSALLQGTNDNGVLESEYPGGKACVCVLRDKANLYLGFRLRTTLAEPVVSLALLNRFAVPVHLSSTYTAYLSPGEVLTQRFAKGGQLQSWDCTWRLAERATADGWEAEISIPFESVGVDSPQGDERWRMNCSVASARRETPAAVVSWGDEDADKPEHGVLLVMGR